MESKETNGFHPLWMLVLLPFVRLVRVRLNSRPGSEAR